MSLSVFRGFSRSVNTIAPTPLRVLGTGADVLGEGGGVGERGGVVLADGRGLDVGEAEDDSRLRMRSSSSE